jgi:hypothetical protein
VDFGLDQIRSIFQGGKTKGTPVAAKGSYDPNKTYYNKDGSVFRPAAQKKVTKKVLVTPAMAAKKVAKPVAAPRRRTAAKKPAYRYDQDGDLRIAERGKPYYDNSGDLRYTKSNPYYDNSGDLRFGSDTLTGKAPTKPGATTYKTVTTKTGLTAAQQFAKALKGLQMAGAGKTYGGVEPILAARKKAQEQFYLPQLDEQRDEAKEQLVYALARAGQGVSTTAKKRNVEVDEGFNRERAGVHSKIAADISEARGDYEQQRQSLESQLRASGDATAATQAATRGMAMFAKDAPELRPLENALLGLTTGIGGAKQAYDVAQIRQRAQGGSTVNRNLSRTVG